MSLIHSPEHDTVPTQGVIDMKRSVRQTVPFLVPFAFGIYGVLLIVLTLLKGYLSLGGMWDMEAHHLRSLDLVLFNGFIGAPIWWGPWTNTFGNIALFIPFGFLLYILLKNRSRFPLLEVTAFAGVTSLVIEIVQFAFAAGYTDVDDLLFNTIGGFLGGVLAWKAPRAAVSGLSLCIVGGCLAVLALIISSSLG